MGSAPSLIMSYHLYKKFNESKTHKLIYNTNLYGKRNEQNSKTYFTLPKRKRKKKDSKNISRGFSGRLFRFKYLSG
jgi:hypothetical protein